MPREAEPAAQSLTPLTGKTVAARLQRLAEVDAAPGVADDVRVLQHAVVPAADSVAHPAIAARVHESAPHNRSLLRAVMRALSQPAAHSRRATEQAHGAGATN